MEKANKILGGIFLIGLIFPTLVLGGSVTLDHGTNSLVEYDDMGDLTDKTLTINWSNDFNGYDGTSDAEVFIGIYVPVDYGVDSENDVTISWSNNDFQFEVNYVSDGTCTELNNIVADEGGTPPWSTNCTLISINGTLKSPVVEGVGFNLSININLSDSCTDPVNGICLNNSYQLMFSDLITYKKEVDNAVCDPSTYNGTRTYCYVNGNEEGVIGVNYSYCKMYQDCYSCAMPGNRSDNVICDITKGIGNMTNSSDIMEQGTTGKVVSIPYVSYTIELVEGWNFISLPVDVNNKSIENVLKDIEGRYEYIRNWDTSTQKFDTYNVYLPQSMRPFALFENKQSYVIYCNDSNGASLTLTGQLYYDMDITLSPGWNDIQWPYLFNTNVSNALEDIEGNYEYIRSWNSSSQKFDTYNVHLPSSMRPFTQFEQMKGYIVYVNATSNVNLHYDRNVLSLG